MRDANDAARPNAMKMAFLYGFTIACAAEQWVLSSAAPADAKCEREFRAMSARIQAAGLAWRSFDR